MAETIWFNDFPTMRKRVWKDFGKFPAVLIYPHNADLIYFYQADQHIATWDSAREAGYIFGDPS